MIPPNLRGSCSDSVLSVSIAHGAPLQKFERSNQFKLLGQLHESCHSEGRIAVGFLHHFVEIYKLKVVEFPFGKAVIEFVHHFPGAISNSNNHDAQWVIGANTIASMVSLSFTTCPSAIIKRT